MNPLDILRDVIKGKPILFLVVFSVIGCLFGWCAMGYVIWPVQYTGESYSYELNQPEKEQYLLMLADSYRVTGNTLEVQKRLKGWSDSEVTVLIANMSINLRNQGLTDQAQRIEDLAGALGTTTSPVNVPTAIFPPESPPSAPPQPATQLQVAGFPIMSIIQICIGLIVIFVLIAAILFFIDLRKRKSKPTPPKTVTGGKLAPEIERDEGALGHFITKYTFGDDHYDESFSIETPTGAFLGECGVGISESLESGPPSKVTAFEVWLFDKSDIRTITKVLMSEFAFNEPNFQDKLAVKGEMLLAQIGQIFNVATDTFDMQVRVMDFSYGTKSEYPNSYFDSLTVELIVKPQQPIA